MRQNSRPSSLHSLPNNLDTIFIQLLQIALTLLIIVLNYLWKLPRIDPNKVLEFERKKDVTIMYIHSLIRRGLSFEIFKNSIVPLLLSIGYTEYCRKTYYDMRDIYLHKYSSKVLFFALLLLFIGSILVLLTIPYHIYLVIITVIITLLFCLVVNVITKKSEVLSYLEKYYENWEKTIEKYKELILIREMLCHGISNEGKGAI